MSSSATRTHTIAIERTRPTAAILARPRWSARARRHCRAVLSRGAAWLPGGFLGVEIFFTISGYLITSLLLAEWRETGRIVLKHFWLRRARRLLPALFPVIIASLAFAVLFLPDEVASLRSDALASFGYSTNWYLIFSKQSYFEAVGRPSLLRHLWSLAVEEQFYVLWPLIFVFTMRRWRERSRAVRGARRLPASVAS